MSPRQRGGLVPSTKARQRLALTPSMRQSMELWSQRGMTISRMIKALSDDNPYLDVTMPTEYTTPQTGMDVSSTGLGDLDRVDHDYVYPVSLASHLFTAIGQTVRNPDDRAVALAMVEHVSAAGWLEESGLETARAMGCDGVRLDRLLDQLHAIEPAGLFARNLAECLRLQLEDRGS